MIHVPKRGLCRLGRERFAITGLLYSGKIRQSFNQVESGMREIATSASRRDAGHFVVIGAATILLTTDPVRAYSHTIPVERLTYFRNFERQMAAVSASTIPFAEVNRFDHFGQREETNAEQGHCP